MDTQQNHDIIWKKHYYAYLASQTISFFGTTLVQYAIVWYITLKTGSGFMVTITMLCSFLPQLLISPFAGVWADRYNRKMLIMVADGMIAFTTLVLAILFLFGIDYYWLLFIAASMRSLGSGIQSPANDAMIPQLVPQEKMMKMNGMKHSVESAMLLISPAVSGVLLNYMGLIAVFFLDVISAAIGITVLCFVKAKAYKESKDKAQQSYFGDMKLGLAYIKSHKFLLPVFLSIGFFMFLTVPVAYFSPLMIERKFDGEVWRLTLNEILFSFGTLVGGIIVSTWGGFQNRMKTMALAAAGFGILTIAIGVSPMFWLFLCMVTLSGIFVPLMTVTSTVFIQENVEEDMLGRVFSILQMVLTAVIPCGTLIFGPLTDYILIEYLCIVTGALMMAIGLVAIGSKKASKSSFQKETGLEEAIECK